LPIPGTFLVEEGQARVKILALEKTLPQIGRKGARTEIYSAKPLGSTSFSKQRERRKGKENVARRDQLLRRNRFGNGLGGRRTWEETTSALTGFGQNNENVPGGEVAEGLAGGERGTGAWNCSERRTSAYKLRLRGEKGFRELFPSSRRGEEVLKSRLRGRGGTRP